MTSKHRVLRTHISEYQAPDFKQKEKELIESIDGCSYVSSWEDNPNILITNTHTIPEELPKNKLSEVELIIHPNSGTDRWSPEFLNNLKAKFVPGNPIRAKAVAEYSLSCLFQHYATPPFDNVWEPGRTWDRKLISDLTIQLIGHGHIGKILSNTLTGLGAKVNISDPGEDLNQLLWEEADAIIMACSLNETSEKLINADVLTKLKKDVVIINGARGKLIDQKNLLAFLNDNHLAYAYLDVFEMEPFEAEEFENMANVGLTSHIAGVHQDLDAGILNFVASEIRRFLP